MDLDELAIKRAQGGDAQAQAEILRQHARALRHLVTRLGPRERDPEDQMQDLYEKILAALPRFRIAGPARLGTWIHAVAHHWLISQRRKPALRAVPLEEEAMAVVDARPLPDRAFEASQLRAALDEAIHRLPEAQRRVYVLAQLHEQPLEEIAAVEGVPIGTVKSRLHRAKAELVVLLGEALDVDRGEANASTGRS